MEDTQQVVLNKLLISTFNAWRLIVEKTEEISKQRDIIKKQYEDANELMVKLEKKAEELKTVMYFFKNMINIDDTPVTTD
jgi:hypothetical protein|tara:strand:- start:3170 stop:3409 length:240 start_codon:yes stop_codon:yes gene_type:complete